MPITVECPNGHKVRVKDELAGKRIKCPRCKTPARVPASGETPRPVRKRRASTATTDQQEMGSLPRRRRGRSASGRAVRKPRKSNPRRIVLVGGSAVAVVGLLGIAVLIWNSFSSSPAGFESPEAAFTAFQSAVSERDWKHAAQCTTDESQNSVAAGLGMIVSFMAAFDSTMLADVESLFAEHGLDMDEPPAGMEMDDPATPLASVVKDKPAFIAGLIELMLRMDKESGEEPIRMLTSARLGDVKITGSNATATVTSSDEQETLEFRQVDGLWLIHFSEEALAFGGSGDATSVVQGGNVEVHSGGFPNGGGTETFGSSMPEMNQPQQFVGVGDSNSRPSAHSQTSPASATAMTDTRRQAGSNQQKKGEVRASRAGENLNITAAISAQEPHGMMLFGDIERQNPVFLTLRIQGEAIVNGIEYGKFRFDTLHDDQGRALKLLKPVEGQFNEKLQEEVVELNHFFLERPDLLQLHLIIETPASDAKQVRLTGSFHLATKESITIDNVLAKLNQPLSAPGLDRVGRFIASVPRPDESDVTGSLAIDFTGDRSLIDDIELLRGDGYKISTGGTGQGSARQARIIRWAGEELSENTKLRILLKTAPKQVSVPFEFEKIPVR